MKRSVPAALGAVLVALATMGPVAAQGDAISMTPADGLLDGQTVEISATTTGSNYATLGLCPAAAAPVIGAPVTDLLSTRNICVGLVCLHDGETEASLIEVVSADCPLAVQPRPISSVSTAVALPRFTNDGTDCAMTDCVVVFNTWNDGSAQGAVSARVTFDATGQVSTASTTTVGPPSDTADSTTTTIALSSPSATSTAAPEASTTTLPAVVLGAQEDNDGQLAMTGIDPGALAAVGLALTAAGAVAVTRARPESVGPRSR